MNKSTLELLQDLITLGDCHVCDHQTRRMAAARELESLWIVRLIGTQHGFRVSLMMSDVARINSEWNKK